MTNDTAVWCIHAGSDGDADGLFLHWNVIALGYKAMGDLGALAPDRDAFKERAQQALLKSKPGAIPAYAGQTYRFVHEARVDDLVAYPSQRDKRIHIGRIEGLYKHDLGINSRYPNMRDVRWIAKAPRTHFSLGALYEVGAAMSFFQLKNYADEFIAFAAGEPPDVSIDTDPTIGLVAAEVEQSTRDYLQKTLLRKFKGHRFVLFVADLLETMGYRTKLPPAGTEKGTDILAFRDELGLQPPIIRVQVKTGEGSVGSPEVQTFAGAVGDRNAGLVVTPSVFSKQAVDFAAARGSIRLLDGDAVIDLLLKHYEELDPKYRSEIPMRRVYIPESGECNEV